jgi:hypothetical protein
MTRPAIEARIVESLGRRLEGWNIAASMGSDGGWVVAMSHPASAGLHVETGTADEDDAVEIAGRVLEHSAEIDIARAAPVLSHAELVMGLRTIAAMFEWESREVKAVVFLMFEHGHLTIDEATWLAGYEGIDAPMQPRSPRR